MVLYEESTVNNTNPAITKISITAAYMKAVAEYCKANPDKYLRVKVSIENNISPYANDVLVWYGKRTPEAKRRTLNYRKLASPFSVGNKTVHEIYKGEAIEYIEYFIVDRTKAPIYSHEPKPFTKSLGSECNRRVLLDKNLSVKVSTFDFDTFSDISKVNAEAEASMRTNKAKAAARKYRDDMLEFLAERPITVKAPYINAGSCVPFGLIGNADDFIDWYCCTAFSAEMADSYSTISSERAQLSKSADELLGKLDISQVDLLQAQERFVKNHPEGGYCLYFKR